MSFGERTMLPFFFDVWIDLENCKAGLVCRSADQIQKNTAWSSTLDPNPDPNP
jgi:hypothetical protein